MRADYTKMKNVLSEYQKTGAPLPTPLAKTFAVLDQAFRSGDNIDAAFNSACMEMGRFLSSSEERCAKPDPEIFELLLARLSVPARAALLVDDNPANVAGAIRVGMDGIVFSSMKQLKSEMPDVFAC